MCLVCGRKIQTRKRSFLYHGCDIITEDSHHDTKPQNSPRLSVVVVVSSLQGSQYQLSNNNNDRPSRSLAHSKWKNECGFDSHAENGRRVSLAAAAVLLLPAGVRYKLAHTSLLAISCSKYMTVSKDHTLAGEVFGTICWLWVFHRARHDLPVVLGLKHPWEH